MGHSALRALRIRAYFTFFKDCAELKKEKTHLFLLWDSPEGIDLQNKPKQNKQICIVTLLFWFLRLLRALRQKKGKMIPLNFKLDFV